MNEEKQSIPEAVIVTITAKGKELTVDFNIEDELIVQNVIKGAYDYISEKLMFARFLNNLKQMSTPKPENKIVVPSTVLPSDVLKKE